MNSVVIVDDEPPARRKLVRMLEAHADFSLAGQAGAGEAAVAVIDELRPDLLLLDVQLPDMTGFDVLERLQETGRPLTVFVTAFGHYAVEAFAVRALDYLLKPVSQSRFDAALARARETLRTSKGLRYLCRFLVRGDGIAYFVEAETVAWMESARNYVVLHTPEGTHIVRATLEGIAGKLDPARFARVSRSCIVNAGYVRGFAAGCVHLADGTVLRGSRKYLNEAMPLLL